jgi:hypothetical protein
MFTLYIICYKYVLFIYIYVDNKNVFFYPGWGVNRTIVCMDRWVDTWPKPSQHQATTTRTHSKDLIHALNI